MAFIYRYELKNLDYRKTIDLRKYQNGIARAVTEVFGQSVREITTNCSSFKIRLKHAAANEKLREMGRILAKKNKQLRKFMANDSGIFVRKANEYFAYRVEGTTHVEGCNGEENGAFCIVDADDLHDYFGKELNQSTRVSALKVLDTFSLDVFDLVSKKYRRGSSKRKWYKVVGVNCKNRTFAEITLDILYSDDKGDQDSGFKVAGIEPVFDDSQIEWLNTFFDYATLPHDNKLPDTICQKTNEAKSIIVYNVGQGLCSSICDKEDVPLVYVDFGRACRRNRKTDRGTMAYDFSQNPDIIISHWHEDHWIGVKHKPEALGCRWIVPQQSTNMPRIATLCATLSFAGNLTILASDTAFWGGQIFLCTGNSHLHDNGIGVLAEIKTSEGDIKRYLLPGDNRYVYIPSQHKNNLSGLVASHHGGDYGAQTSQGIQQIPAGTNEAIIIYSYGVFADGRHNTYGHPTHENDYINAGWTKEQRTPYGNCKLG
jgi:hypothetical protein